MNDRSDNSALRLASVNIEGDKHLDTVLGFLKNFGPDVVCMQELSEPTVSFFEKELRMDSCFSPMERKRDDAPDDPMPPRTPIGLGIFSKFPFAETANEYYYQSGAELPTFVLGDETTVWRSLLSAAVEKEGHRYAVATTHFTRTPDGSTSDKQRKDIKNLMKLLEKRSGLVLAGDFNAPRGGEMFAALASRYKDNIPPEYVSSLDPKLHKLKDAKKLMVDGLFTTPAYRAEQVALVEGVSDHKAVTAVISRV